MDFVSIIKYRLFVIVTGNQNTIDLFIIVQMALHILMHLLLMKYPQGMSGMVM